MLKVSPHIKMDSAVYESQNITPIRRPIIIPVNNVSSQRVNPPIRQTRTITPQWVPRVLIIGHGGMKGMKGLGFLSPVEDSGLLNYTDTHVGVSIGALISLLMICGYRIREIVGEAVKLDVFKEIEAFDFRSVMDNRGFMSSEPVRRRLTQLVVNKFGIVPTLHGLYMMTGKSFIVITLNASDEKCVILNPSDNPDMSCVDATMFSMNVPYVFYQLVHRGKIYVDGALANPYPIEYFDDGNTNILGIYMKASSPKTTPVSHPTGGIIQRIDDTIAPLPIGSYSFKIINSLLDHRYYSIVHRASDHCKHVCLEVKTDDLIGYGATTESKAALLVEGFNEGKAFIEQLLDGTYQGPKIPDPFRYKYPTYFMMGEDEQVNPESVDMISEMSINT